MMGDSCPTGADVGFHWSFLMLIVQVLSQLKQVLVSIMGCVSGIKPQWIGNGDLYIGGDTNMDLWFSFFFFLYEISLVAKHGWSQGTLSPIQILTVLLLLLYRQRSQPSFRSGRFTLTALLWGGQTQSGTETTIVCVVNFHLSPPQFIITLFFSWADSTRLLQRKTFKRGPACACSHLEFVCYRTSRLVQAFSICVALTAILYATWLDCRAKEVKGQRNIQFITKVPN